MRKIKIILTGGHAGSTAYAVIEEISYRHPQWDVFFIGGKSSIEGKDIKTLAYLNFNKSKVKYYSLNTGRLQRKFTIWTIPSLLKIPIGFIQSLFLLIKINPDIVLSFGGYAAFPVVLSSWLLGKSVVIHEQTAAAGRSNLASQFFAKKIALARAESGKYFVSNKCEVTGNPLTRRVLKLKPKSKKNEPPVLFIHGGSSGSVTLNNLTDKILEKLLLNYKVIHQTGRMELQKYLDKKRLLPKNLKKRYEVFGMVKSKEFYKYLDVSDILISRSGANIVSEIIYVKIPSILIPIPFSYQNEQAENARYAENFGIAKMLDQASASPEELLKAVDEVNANWKNMVIGVSKKLSPDINASGKTIDLIESLL